MKKSASVLTLLIALVVGGVCSAAEPLPASVKPVPRTKQFEWMSVSTWYEKHAADVALAEAGEARVVFLGDSITDGWDWTEIWKNEIAPLKAVNFGIGGDLTQNVLWRLDHGDIEKLNPELVVVLIGVNNFLHNDASVETTFAGVRAVVERALSAYPDAQVLVQGIFPYEQSGKHPNRKRVSETNRLIATLADLPRVSYHDFGALLVDDKGNISPEVMADFLHPTAKGYRIWADALLPLIHAQLDN